WATAARFNVSNGSESLDVERLFVDRVGEWQMRVGASDAASGPSSGVLCPVPAVSWSQAGEGLEDLEVSELKPKPNSNSFFHNDLSANIQPQKTNKEQGSVKVLVLVDLEKKAHFTGTAPSSITLTEDKLKQWMQNIVSYDSIQLRRGTLKVLVGRNGGEGHFTAVHDRAGMDGRKDVVHLVGSFVLAAWDVPCPEILQASDGCLRRAFLTGVLKPWMVYQLVISLSQDGPQSRRLEPCKPRSFSSDSPTKIGIWPCWCPGVLVKGGV
ncbi:hypothetical protein FCULG_00003177, partial [Fusarium culmorum]